MPTAILIVNEPNERARVVPIVGTYVSIGRERDNNIRVEKDEYVSRYHAMIEVRDDGYWLSDLESSNDTTVNDELLKAPRRLNHKDIIGIGEATTIEFHLSSGSKQESKQPEEDLNKTAAGITPLPPQPKETVEKLASQTDPSKLPAVNNRLPLLPILAIAGILLVGALLADLYYGGVIGGQTDDNDSVEAENRGQKNGNQNMVTLPTPEPTQTPTQTDTPPPTDPTPTETPDASDGDDKVKAVQTFAPALAAQVSQKSPETYRFDPGFVQLIAGSLDEYKTAAGFHDRAQKYVSAVQLHFGEGSFPLLIPYVVAMSQTKFRVNDSGGVWFASLPPALAGASNGADINDVALKHLRYQLEHFTRDEFMYAVACYGMSDSEVGEMGERLRNADPTGRERYDFWKMKNKGVVKDEQVKRVVRFFAAGIVCEHPAYFHLKDESLSSLIN